MQLHLSSWPEVQAYLERSKAIVIPVGSTEQHGPNGLLGTDAICPEIIARRAGDEAGLLVGPTFNVGQSQHHMGFTGTITLRPSTMLAAVKDWIDSLRHHGFRRIYWLNGHGGNVATLNAAFAEAYRDASFAGAEAESLRCLTRNWWELPGVGDVVRQYFPSGEGSHAAPSEVSVTRFAYPEAIKNVEMSPRIAPVGPFSDAHDYRRRFPDGRIGSDPSQANVEAGGRLVEAAARAVISEFRQFEAG